MKLHDLRPAPGSTTERTRVGRGIAAGKGKTAGRGTKGQKSRAGGSMPAGFEGGQTPIRSPRAEAARLQEPVQDRLRSRQRWPHLGVRRTGSLRRGRGGHGGCRPTTADAKGAPLTVNGELLRAAGLIGTLRQPVKVLGGGEIDGPLFVVADAFTRSAREKIEAAGGTAQLIELPDRPMPAIGLTTDEAAPSRRPSTPLPSTRPSKPTSRPRSSTLQPWPSADAIAATKATKAPKAGKASKAAESTEAAPVDGDAAARGKKPTRKRTKPEPAE